LHLEARFYDAASLKKRCKRRKNKKRRGGEREKRRGGEKHAFR